MTCLRQKFCSILVTSSKIRQLQILLPNFEGDKPQWTVRYRAHLILSGCYSTWSTASESMILGQPDLVRSAKFWQNFLNHLVTVVIYEGLYFDLAQGQMNGAPNETRTHSCRFASLTR